VGDLTGKLLKLLRDTWACAAIGFAKIATAHSSMAVQRSGFFIVVSLNIQTRFVIHRGHRQ